MIRRFGRLALLVGAVAAIIAWIVRRREAANVIRESFRESYETAREKLTERVQGRGQETIEEPARGTEEAGSGPREEMRALIRESIRRSRGEA